MRTAIALACFCYYRHLAENKEEKILFLVWGSITLALALSEDLKELLK